MNAEQILKATTEEDDNDVLIGSATASPPVQNKFFFTDRNNNEDACKPTQNTLMKSGRMFSENVKDVVYSATPTTAAQLRQRCVVEKYVRKPIWEYEAKPKVDLHPYCRRPIWEY